LTFIPSYAQIDSPDPINPPDLATKNYVDLRAHDFYVGVMIANNGSQNAGTYNTVSGTIPAPRVNSVLVGQLYGTAGYGGTAVTSMQADLKRTDTNVSIVYGGSPGTLQQPSAQTQTFFLGVYLNPVPAGLALPVQGTVIITGSSNCYTTHRLIWQMIPL
jgi:hypothetical protein